MAQDLVIAGATYEDVPSISVPKNGGGVADYVDTSDANAAAEDILKDKTAYVNGEKVIGTYEGGSATLITKNITENGTYNASSDNADGYSSVSVNVPSNSYEIMNKFFTQTLEYFKSNVNGGLWHTNLSIYQINLKFFSMRNAKYCSTDGRPFCDSALLKYCCFGLSDNTGGIGVYAFRSVGNCTIVMRNKTVIGMNSSRAFDRNTNTYYVPDLDNNNADLPAQYKVASNWAAYATQIKGYSEAPSYDAGTTYTIGNVCKYNGKFYGYCKEDLTSSTGNAPSGTTEDNEYWEYVDDIEV